MSNAKGEIERLFHSKEIDLDIVVIHHQRQNAVGWNETLLHIRDTVTGAGGQVNFRHVDDDVSRYAKIAR